MGQVQQVMLGSCSTQRLVLNVVFELRRTQVVCISRAGNVGMASVGYVWVTKNLMEVQMATLTSATVLLT